MPSAQNLLVHRQTMVIPISHLHLYMKRWRYIYVYIYGGTWGLLYVCFAQLSGSNEKVKVSGVFGQKIETPGGRPN